MKIIKFFLLLIVLVIIFTFLTYIFYNSFIIEKVYILDMKIKISDHFGLNADTDSINFGMLMPGTSGERAIFLNNNATYPLKVLILKSGYIAEWVKISENNFILKEKENKEIIFEAFIPKNINFGNYTGKVKVIFKKTLFSK